jgi:N-acetylmuramoyl-L-alanine amidase
VISRHLTSSHITLSAWALALAMSFVGQLGSQSGPSLTVISREGRRSIAVSVVNDQELVALDELATTFQLAVREEAGATTVSYKGRTIVLSTDQTIASVAGRMISLPTRPVRSGGRLLVPVDFISRAVAPIYDARIDLRRASRLVVVGDLRVPRVSITTESLPAGARVTIDVTPPLSPTLSQEGDHLSLRFDADTIDVSLPGVQPQGFLQGLRRTDGVTLAIDLGPRYGSYRSSTETGDARTRMTLELLPAPTETTAATPAVPPASPPPQPVDLPAFGQPTAVIRTVTLDAGHGGTDPGAKGAGGLLEKQLTLTVARRTKAMLEGRLGLRVLMTRDDDRDVSFDSRTAVANNNKADLYISFHANTSFRPSAAGLSVLVSSFPDEAEVRRSLAPVRVPVFGGGLRDIEIVAWNQAQIRFVEQSDLFARTLIESLQGRVPLDARPTGRVPLRVLAAANMPAVLVELGYLSNPDQEGQMPSNDFQGAFVQALVDAVVRYRDRLTHGDGGDR